MNDMSFGIAIEIAKVGKRIARKSWQDDSFVFLVSETPVYVRELQTFEQITPNKEEPVYQPYLAIYNQVESCVQEWTPTRSDMLCCNWYILEDYNI